MRIRDMFNVSVTRHAAKRFIYASIALLLQVILFFLFILFDVARSLGSCPSLLSFSVLVLQWRRLFPKAVTLS